MRVTWDLTYLCESKEKWQEYVCDLQEQVKLVEKLIQSCDSQEALETCLKAKIQMDELIERVYCYPRRLLDLNREDGVAKEMFELALQCYSETEKQNGAFQKLVLENRSLIEQFLEVQPFYQRYFDLIFDSTEHQVQDMETYAARKEALEKVKEEYRSLSGRLEFEEVMDEDGTLVEATKQVLARLSSSSGQEDRKRSCDITMRAYERISDALAHLYHQKRELERDIAHLQNFDSVLEEQLFENGLHKGSVSKLVEVARNHVEIEHELIRLKKELSGLEEFHIYDMAVRRNSNQKISLEEAYRILKEVFSILGPDYMERFEQGFQNGSLDLGKSDVKRQDSFSCITYSGLPYTMMTYKETIDSLRGLAHETGHMMHTSYAKENEFLYFEYPIFLAEIASKVHEMLLYHYLLEHSEKEEQEYILEQLLSSFCTSFFSQAMLTEFELEAHEREFKSAQELRNLYSDLAYFYYGDSMEMDSLLGLNWCKVLHFFIYPSYYVWQYATGVSIASKIASDLIEDRNDMRKKYIAFLKAGNRMSVTDALALVDIDLNDGTYLEDACTFMKEKIKVLQRT